MELSDAKKIKQADAVAIHERGIDSLLLMERAASALADAAAERMVNCSLAVAFCGPGNNGGDGVAAARLLLTSGVVDAVRVYLVGDREKMTADTRAMEEKLRAAGAELVPFDGRDESLPGVLAGAGVIIDAIFGVGLSRPVQGDVLRAVQRMNEAAAPVVSADIPTGISADTGEVLGEAVMADATVTFSLGKVGLYTEPGCVYSGEVTVADIGIPKDILAAAGCGVYAIGAGDLKLPSRKRISHKGDYGKLLILGGSIPYTGAPAMAAKGALRAGAGLVYVGVPADIYEIEAIKNQEAMVFPLASGEKGRVARRAWGSIAERLSVCDVCVIGPGMGRGEDTRWLTEQVITAGDIPVVADADALWAIAQEPGMLDKATHPVVLTPHEGEFSRLLGRAVKNRLEDSLAFSKEHHCVVVLKGHRTVCAFPDGKAYIIDAGNPGMAKGGSGDVLAGVLGAMLGQLPCRRAVVTGCWLHAAAGDAAAGRLGEYAMTAGDIIESLSHAELEILE